MGFLQQRLHEVNGVGVLKREEINILSVQLREIILPYKEE